MLYSRLNALGTIVVILSDSPEFRKKIPVIMRRRSYTVEA